MPSEIVGTNTMTEVQQGPVAVVALANALLDMSITVQDDSLVKLNWIQIWTSKIDWLNIVVFV